MVNNSYQETKTLLSNNIGIIKNNNDIFNKLCVLITLHPNYHEWKYHVPLKMKIIMKKYIQLHILFEGTKKYRIVSWVQCCKKVTKKDPLTSAMRHAIKRQITIYKNKNPTKQCNICGNKDNIEVDHYPTKFVQLKNDFLVDKIIPEQFVFHPKRGYCFFHKKDAAFKASWQKYHNKHATYRYLCSTCNKKY